MDANRAKLSQLIQVLAFASNNGLDLAVNDLIPSLTREFRVVSGKAKHPQGYDPNPPRDFDSYCQEAYRKVGSYNTTELINLMRANQKISYIKILREKFSLGLREAKYVADYRFDYQRHIFS